MSEIIRITIAPLFWLAAFSGVYGLQGLGCAMGWDGGGPFPPFNLRGLLIVAWLGTVAVSAGMVAALRSDTLGSPSPTLRRISVACAWVGLVASVWSLLPISWATPCG